MFRQNSYKIQRLTLALVVTAAAGCSTSDDEPAMTDANAIEFARPEITMGETEVVSRGQMLKTMPENELFGVIGYCIPFTLRGSDATVAGDLDYFGGESDWSVKKANIRPGLRINNDQAELLMQPIMYDGKKCVYSDGGSGYVHPAHWYEKSDVGSANPDALSYTFIAYHPYTTDRGAFELMGAGAEDKKYNIKGVPRLKYTTPYQKDGGTHDMNVYRDPDKAKDAMVAVTYNSVRAAGAVPLAFDHIQSAIRIQLNNLSADKDVTVSEMRIMGSFYHSAVWDFSGADPKLTVDRNEVFSGYFPFVKTESPLTVKANTATVPGVDADHDMGTTILLLPDLDNPNDGQYLGYDKKIRLTYAFAGDAPKTVEFGFTLGRKPEMGRLYTLNLNFIGNQILLMFTADATEYWEPGSNNEIIIN